MREILFRGKRLANGEWIAGCLVKYAYNSTPYIGYLDAWGDGIYEVDPSTVGQFTGRCDKNKVRIFEGDVCVLSAKVYLSAVGMTVTLSFAFQIEKKVLGLLEHLIEDGVGILKYIIEALNDARDTYLNFDEYFDNNDLAKEIKCKKDVWWQMIQLLPSSYNQLRTVQLNYQVLKNMYHARKEHKLDE